MTRPMPGPPEHDRYARPHRRFADERCSTCYSPGWTLPKWLTDAECAAEYWRAVFDHARPLAANTFVPTPEWDRSCQEVDTWRRFKDTPHALEATP